MISPSVRSACFGDERCDPLARDLGHLISAPEAGRLLDLDISSLTQPILD